MAKLVGTFRKRREWASLRVSGQRAGGVWGLLPTILFVIQGCLVLALSGALGMAVGAFVSVQRSVPSDPSLAQFVPKAATSIFSWEGELLGKVWTEKREPVPISQIPLNLQRAVVATEDRRFFHHHGIDFQGILRAARANVLHGRVVEGGSTITQQLARDLYLTRKRTITRKVQEAILAVEIERRYSKQEVLELYLNQVNFGHAAYGVNCAAHVYFGKDLDQLTLAECAMLAGLPRRPALYSPYNDAQQALSRRNQVLHKMRENGYITEGQLQVALKEPIRLAGDKPSLWEQVQAPYFTSYVVQELVKKYGEKRVYEGGLRVFTTLEMPVQSAAEKAVQEQYNRLKSLRASQAALVAIHPETGYIIAMVGGTDYSQSEFNRATQALRQPGSSFKPFVYATAIGLGMTPSSSINAQAQNIGGWVCKNSGGGGYGVVSLQTGLAHSINTAAVNLQQRVGTENVIRTARAMGITSPLLPVPSLAVGSNEVTLLEMTSAFGTYVAGGIHYEAMGIVRVEDHRGMVIDRFEPKPVRALTTKTADVMKKMLQGVIRFGTGTRAAGVDPEAGGKTGTTDDYRDVWFFGFVANLVAGVWAGNDNHLPTAHLFGGTACAPTWKSFMLEGLKGFTPPPTLGTALGEEGAVTYDLSKRKADRRVKRQEVAPPPPPTEEPAPTKASTARTKASSDLAPVSGFVRPGVGKGEASPTKASAAAGGLSGLQRGLGGSSSHPIEGETKASD